MQACRLLTNMVSVCHRQRSAASTIEVQFIQSNVQIHMHAPSDDVYLERVFAC